MRRRDFLGTIAAGATVGISGCLGGPVPTGVVHGLLEEDSNVERLRNDILDEGIQSNDIYISEYMRALQIKGSYDKLKVLIDDLPIAEYKLYSVSDFLPISHSSRDPMANHGLPDFPMLEELNKDAYGGSNVSVGLIETTSNWRKWYNGDVERIVASERLHPILGPLLGDKWHGVNTAKTLFHPDNRVTSDPDYIKGLIPEAKPYHAEISAVTLLPSFFRGICTGLEWMDKKGVDVITIPWSVSHSERTILTRIMEEFVSKQSNSVIVVASGNVDVCEGEINALANTESPFIIGVGSIESGSSQDYFSGRAEVSDVMGPSGFKIGNNKSYSGTSASSTVVSGVLALYIDALKEWDVEIDPSMYRSLAVQAMNETSPEFVFNGCSESKQLNRLAPSVGFEVLKSYV